MQTYCTECGTAIEARYCWRCGTAAAHHPVEKPNGERTGIAIQWSAINSRLHGIPAVVAAVALGLFFYLIPIAGFVGSLAALTALAFWSLRQNTKEVPD